MYRFEDGKKLSRPLKSNLGRTTIVIPKAVTNLTVNNSGRWSKRLTGMHKVGLRNMLFTAQRLTLKSFLIEPSNQETVL